MAKRTGYISWDEYFIGVALLSGQRSKDPATQVGACIVNQQNKIVGAGYNGLPIGCNDDDFPWDKKGSFLKPNILMSVMQSLMPFSIISGWTLPVVEYTQLFSRVMNAAKQLYNRASKK